LITTSWKNRYLKEKLGDAVLNQILPEKDQEFHEGSGNGFRMSLEQQHISEIPSRIAKRYEGYLHGPSLIAYKTPILLLLCAILSSLLSRNTAKETSSIIK